MLIKLVQLLLWFIFVFMILEVVILSSIQLEFKIFSMVYYMTAIDGFVPDLIKPTTLVSYLNSAVRLKQTNFFENT